MLSFIHSAFCFCGNEADRPWNTIQTANMCLWRLQLHVRQITRATNQIDCEETIDSLRLLGTVLVLKESFKNKSWTTLQATVKMNNNELKTQKILQDFKFYFCLFVLTFFILRIPVWNTYIYWLLCVFLCSSKIQKNMFYQSGLIHSYLLIWVKVKPFEILGFY